MPRKWIAALSSAAVLAAASAVSASGQTAASPRMTVATVTTVDDRAVVFASKASAGGAPTADVTVVAYVRARGAWHRVAERRLDGPFFWNTVTAPHALCRLELASVGTRTTTHLRVTVQLLASPSLGCGRAQTMPLPAS